jgi:hypothetical protein
VTSDSDSDFDSTTTFDLEHDVLLPGWVDLSFESSSDGSLQDDLDSDVILDSQSSETSEDSSVSESS